MMRIFTSEHLEVKIVFHCNCPKIQSKFSKGGQKWFSNNKPEITVQSEKFFFPCIP